jgi:hypothetical protein
MEGVLLKLLYLFQATLSWFRSLGSGQDVTSSVLLLVTNPLKQAELRQSEGSLAMVFPKVRSTEQPVGGCILQLSPFAGVH